MFDKITFEGSNRVEHVPFEKTVHEHKAPTDASIAYYEELTTKIREKIVGELRFEDNTLLNFKCVVFNDVATYNIIFGYQFLLNGVMLKNQFKIDSLNYYDIEKALEDRELMNYILRTVCEKIASDIARRLAPGLYKALRKVGNTVSVDKV